VEKIKNVGQDISDNQDHGEYVTKANKTDKKKNDEDTWVVVKNKVKTKKGLPATTTTCLYEDTNYDANKQSEIKDKS
jgi:hypothetical protein